MLKTTCINRYYVGQEKECLDAVKCSSIRSFINQQLNTFIINDLSKIIVSLLCGTSDEETDKYYVDDVRKLLSGKSHY